MNTAIAIDVPHLRTQLTLHSRRAETALDRAFDLQQAGAPAASVDAALAEAARLQAAVSDLQAQLNQTLH